MKFETVGHCCCLVSVRERFDGIGLGGGANPATLEPLAMIPYGMQIHFAASRSFKAIALPFFAG